MSKRNFTLLIIILIIVTAAVFAFFYFRKTSVPPGENGGGTNFDIPFGSGGTKNPPAVTPPVDVSGFVPPTEGETPLGSKLVRVSSMPIAGFTVFSKERLKEVVEVFNSPGPGESIADTKRPAKKTIPLTEFVPALRYVDRATGNIYQTFADKIMERKFSGTVIPKVYEAYFGNRGESVVMRYLKTDGRTIETFVGALPKELLGADTTIVHEVKGSFLPNNVKDISVSPDSQKIFYLFESGNNLGDSMAGVILNLLTNKKTQVFESPFTEWLAQWPSSNIITLSTKPSRSIPGYTYTMDSFGKNMNRILGNINGLTTLEAPNGKLILVGDSNLILSIYNTDTRNSAVLGIKTLPEKCVWSKLSDTVYCAAPKSIGGGEYPDGWYQGEVSFDDQIWKVDIKTGNATLLLDPTTILKGLEIDGIKLGIDEGQQYLFFVNKKDSFLWELTLK